MSLDPARMIPMANAIRALSMDAVQKAQSGHPGMPMGMADVATVLWSNYLKYDSAAPHWADRDRFVLSAGHGSMLIYSLLHLSGYAHPTMEEIENFRQLGSPTAGHPENFLLPGVECTTGPLGQGLAMAVGMAMAERHLNAEFGDELVDHRTWVIAGDGCLMEGINHEAIGLAGHLNLSRLVVFWDDNQITIDGSTDLSTSENVRARFEATGWFVNSCDGHDYADIARAIDEAMEAGRPALIACRTMIGRGAPNKQGTAATHGAPLGAEEVAAAREELNWQAAPFEIPDQVRQEWRSAGSRGHEIRSEWGTRLDNSERKGEFQRRMAGDLPEGFDLSEFITGLIREPAKVATRKASENALAVINSKLPETIGGSADLTGSNNTKTAGQEIFSADDRSGRYVYYGIREFGMSAAMNGMALHGGVIPYGGTFLVFSDYCRPAIRLSALQEARVIYVMTHDSIGLGEDGPTHQPVEHLQSLRVIPNLLVMRPGDAVETAECWEIALQQKKRPTVLALSRQGLAQFRTEAAEENHSARGAYRIKDAEADRRVILIATGSEVGLALECAKDLEARGIGADVVSMPCSELFDEQSPAYRDNILPNVGPEEILRVSIEAGTTFGWERYTMANGLRIGIDSFGTSAPAEDAFEKFGFTSEAIIRKVVAKLEE
ncbi:transketolase [Citromicrobium sp. RCC1885]|uniref:transketolase n=1 Tax=unclassified Citromicrobium TaxID=2630544 RepID=UPI0006C8EACC|nr:MULTISPECIES: transketolase [unclassified Citromicrobium]KPM25423.1 transketolase [Citromicrobium sp. RCC1885]KPM28665.1 transketolase [Citromicrobium sp. RCC1878]OAM09790.1 transketolase [Citromicrobium sp. RCC1897]|tara:strand:+ start:669 stop:2660 length:1992 start_codon:yes stop_codon:yes gene_type:complete